MLFLALCASLCLLAYADITGQNPAAGTCLCIDGSSVNIRDGPCGNVIGSSSTGACFPYRGTKQTCSLGGTSYEYFAMTYCGNQVGWTAGTLLNTGSASSCSPATSTPGTCGSVSIVTRSQWGARPPTSTTAMSLPVAKLFIHHSAGASCSDQTSCSAQMRGIQNYHMDSNGWSDIGYNFLVGEDGRAYEGRGWNRVGAHTSGHNSVAVAICVMGDFTGRLPNAAALNAVRHLMNCARSQGVLTSTFNLWGHRDAGTTACPGNTLYAEINKWPEYSCGSP